MTLTYELDLRRI